MPGKKGQRARVTKSRASVRSRETVPVSTKKKTVNEKIIFKLMNESAVCDKGGQNFKNCTSLQSGSGLPTP